MRVKIAAGNWKMNGTASALAELDALRDMLPAQPPQVIICPPAPLLHRARELSGPILIGAQDCHAAPSGAHTGDVSADMVADSGATHVILGHSERRADHGETDADVNAKVRAAWSAGLAAILCLGESEADRNAGKTLEVIGAQLAGSLPDGATAENTVIAYEPIWAIGTGNVPTQVQIVEVHDFLRTALEDRFGPEVGGGIPLLYGGSVKADNAAAIFEAENVDGALVGGASLKAADFAPIVAALAAS
ncbi:triose-phosphate isomerase [Sulfitobacter alexandrii]|uniref:Triosephosphate isomerase n=1 Tax=Sulfitobacter alexandrii TaxID=1917485 RepID=A0A1J0WFX0_9RHOB|nr:triose-phosphate isomerase [Sulfitobacter alexandrii]APE43203.1 triose-phosphate isomerase [Sulfitobacter alexandrii]